MSSVIFDIYQTLPKAFHDADLLIVSCARYQHLSITPFWDDMNEEKYTKNTLILFY